MALVVASQDNNMQCQHKKQHILLIECSTSKTILAPTWTLRNNTALFYTPTESLNPKHNKQPMNKKP